MPFENDLRTAAAARLEFDLHADDVVRLLRLPLLRGIRRERTRRAAHRIVWHDTAEGALAGRGLALAELRGLWRLERMSPDDAPWPPAAPPPVLAEAADRAALPLDLPADVPLLPVAAFHGRMLTLPLAGDAPAAELRLEVLDGALRAVAGERRTALLRLHGPAPAVQALALALAQELRLGVPRQTLAARGRMLALGIAPPPRRLGAPEVAEGMLVADAFAHVCGHLVDVLLHWLDAVPGGVTAEPVHQARVAVRRLRSALSAFSRAAGGPAIGAAQTLLKALAARLGPARDWDVFLAETATDVAGAFPEEPRIAAMVAAGGRRRTAAYAALRAWLATPERRRMEIELACLAALRPWQREPSAPPGPAAPHPEPAMADDNPFFPEPAAPPALPPPLPLDPLALDCRTYAAGMLARRHRRVLRAGRGIAGLSTTALHELRKDCKRLRYACEFFASQFPDKPTRRFLRRMEPLQEALGQLNDSAVAAGLMASLGGGADRAFAGGVVQGFVAGRSGRLRRRIETAWDSFKGQRVFWD